MKSESVLEHTFVVRSRTAMYAGVLVWALLWTLLYKVWRSPEPFVVNSLGSPIVDKLLVLIGFCSLMLLGPIAAFRYSAMLAIDGRRLELHRYFGLVRRLYSTEDVTNVRAKQRGQIRVLYITFRDGVTVRFDSFCANFERLCEYLGA